MKMKILISLLLLLGFQLKSQAQYEMIDMMRQMQMQMYQQQMQQVFSQVKFENHYKCFDGKNITCIIVLARMTGFSSMSVKVRNSEYSKSMDVAPDLSNPMAVSIIVGGSDWQVNYGDRISVTYDGHTKTFDVGVDDNMSEVDWVRYSNYLKSETKVQNAVNLIQPTGSNYNSNTSNSYPTVTQRQCGYCNGTGKCPYCNSAGQSKACVENQFGVRCTDSYCIAHNHKCKHCDGTHICSNCKGTGYK